MVRTKNPKIVICSKCGNQNIICRDEDFVLCTNCKSIKRIKDNKVED